MATGVDFLQLADAHFGVNGGRLQLLVSEQLLDVTDVRPAFEHVRGARVPHQMARRNASGHLFDPARHHPRNHVGVEGVAVAGEEQRRRARVETETRAHFLQVAFEPGDGARADRHDAAKSLPTFGSEAVGGVNTDRVERGKLSRQTHARDEAGRDPGANFERDALTFSPGATAPSSISERSL